MAGLLVGQNLPHAATRPLCRGARWVGGGPMADGVAASIFSLSVFCPLRLVGLGRQAFRLETLVQIGQGVLEERR